MTSQIIEHKNFNLYWKEHLCDSRVDTESRTKDEFTVIWQDNHWYIGAEGILGPVIYYCPYCGTKLP